MEVLALKQSTEKHQKNILRALVDYIAQYNACGSRKHGTLLQNTALPERVRLAYSVITKIKVVFNQLRADYLEDQVEQNLQTVEDGNKVFRERNVSSVYQKQLIIAKHVLEFKGYIKPRGDKPAGVPSVVYWKKYFVRIMQL